MLIELFLAYRAPHEGKESTINQLIDQSTDCISQRLEKTISHREVHPYFKIKLEVLWLPDLELIHKIRAFLDPQGHSHSFTVRGALGLSDSPAVQAVVTGGELCSAIVNKGIMNQSVCRILTAIQIQSATEAHTSQSDK